MPLLIDGHNLIGQMPDIDLADPNDESKLVRRLKRYCWQHNRSATVVFDAGLPGGPSPALSSPKINVVFASRNSSADDIIRHRIRRSRDPRGLLVVSSDHNIQSLARTRGARVIEARDFATEIASEYLTGGEEEKPNTVDDVDMWLQIFEQDE
jgi:predicted RNA-binding protein with PIN domain